MRRKLTLRQAVNEQNSGIIQGRFVRSIIVILLWPLYRSGLVSTDALQGVETKGVTIAKWMILITILVLITWFGINFH